MVVMTLDTDENARNSREETPLFNRGSEVEVRSDEDGFGGAWFPATIVEFTPPKSSSKKRRKGFVVQYKSLVTDDESRPLTENVDPNLVRPSPPQETENGVQVFEENEAVDAWYRDGWWNGIVCKVLEASRYRLYFDKPPDVIDFDGKDLRFTWIGLMANGFDREAGSIFSSGTAVEVNLAKENAWDAWYPALIIKEYENCTFLVKYPDSMSSDESGMDRVIFDSLHIRPAPPYHADRNYELLEKVDVQFGHGWRTGTITKVLTGRRYNVYLRQGNEDTELNHTEIRPHLEWVDGEWISKTKEAMNIPNSEILSVDQKVLTIWGCHTT
ncbi:hypothetical protein K2173_008819 [Erythroxylum novogranatense]|uniref:Agenet domain-containing protein n=1 Tax=Erythroxylum novogranatense TaxID=1862640 RepID=A0AAV8UC08_9ROSI|nr:hypothetical protein K2173_008819 [Erythroxylum novogranatense]